MNEERLMNILVAPHVSEKATAAAEKFKQFVFRVTTDATKPEIRAAVEMMFDVKVDAVRVVNTRGKARRIGAIVGRRAGARKAYVRLQEGYDIDFMGPQ